MSKDVTKPSTLQTPQELLQEICAPHILPDERAETFEAMQQALLVDLTPGTPYEALLAEQLVTLEWEALRHRRMRDSLLKAEFREQAVGAFQNGQVGRVHDFERHEKAEDLAHDIVSDDPERREAALTQLASVEISPEEILAKAYQKLHRSLEPHERHIAEIETRRRKLRAEYEAMKAARLISVEDAEEIAP